MAERILSLRELNRATLARQMLLRREAVSVPAALERLVGMQAQLASAPYVGLWTRLDSFERDDLAALIEQRAVVKATLMRATLHLVTRNDYLRFRAALQHVLTEGFKAVLKDRAAGLDVEQVVAAARQDFAEQPRSFAEITALQTSRMPDADEGAMRYAVRTHLPLVQLPTNTRWSYPGNPKFTLADAWLGEPIPTDDHTPTLIRRYLAAFGPATMADFQTWSGLGKLDAAFEALRPELVTYRDEKKRELFDLPDLPIPDPDTPAPARFLPEFDNLLLSHKLRTRVLADAHRKAVYLPGLRVAPTVLIDGFVGGTWKAEKTRGDVSLVITPFAPLSARDRTALTDDGERLVRFVEPDAKTYTVRVDL